MKKIEFLSKKIEFLLFGAPEKDIYRAEKKRLAEMLVEKRLIQTAIEKLKENPLNPWDCPRGYGGFSLTQLKEKNAALIPEINKLSGLLSDREFSQIQKAAQAEYSLSVKEEEIVVRLF